MDAGEEGVRREQKGTWGKAAGSGRARDVPRKQKRQREGPGDRAGGHPPKRRRLARRAELARDRAAAAAPTRTRGAAGGPSPGAEAEAVASSCSGRPGQAASSFRPPSSLAQAAKLLAHRKHARPLPGAALGPSPRPAFGLGRPVSGPLVTRARAPKSPSCSETGNFRRRVCLLLGCRLESVRRFTATLALAPPSRKLPRVPPNSGSAT